MSKCNMCDKPAAARGLCKPHYYSMRRKKQLNVFSLKCNPLKDRLMSKFSVAENGCWIWNGHKNDVGYPMIWKDGKAVRAHREMYKLFVGELDENKVVCHKCDTPSCVNPDHLFSGTRLDNNRDAVSKNRQAFGERNGHARLSNEQVEAIRQDTRSQSKIAIEYKISQSHVSRIKSREAWRIA